MNGFKDKTVLITGASRGIGAAMAARFAAAGARVLGTATSAASAAAISDSLAEGKGEGLVYDAVADGQVAELVAAVEGKIGSPDIVIVNAAVNADGLLMRLKEDDWQRVLQVNLTAVFLLTRLLVRSMIKKPSGRIILLSSVVASIGNVGQTNYCAAKAGVEGYCRALAKEVAARGVTVNAIAPGFIASDMTDKLPLAIKERFLQNIPAGRAGSVDEVAAVALFLASESASYITGQVIHVNGGLYMG